MTSTGQASGEAFDATAETADSTGDVGAYDPRLHEQLKALAEHAQLSVDLAEQQIASLQEAMEGRRAHAQDAADELRAYEDRHDVNQTSRSTTPQE